MIKEIYTLTQNWFGKGNYYFFKIKRSVVFGGNFEPFVLIKFVIQNLNLFFVYQKSLHSTLKLKTRFSLPNNFLNLRCCCEFTMV